ncbi:MAG TPA: histidine kinase dimerization/phospho-acceptor domain-containing protein, partial [Herpetosiphonaceae bacterium]
GSHITLHLDDGSAMTGRLIGLEASLEPANAAARVLVHHDAQIRIAALDRITRIQLHDQRSDQDVSFFLDVSRIEHTRTTLTLRFAEGDHDLTVAYLAPAPTWRISYRLVRVSATEARLLAWGLFDNSLGEDLENVALTLMSGRPISFEYELYETRIPPRPHVSDDPSELDKPGNDPEFRNMVATISHELRTPLTPIRGFADLLDLGALGPLSDQQREAIRTIKANAMRMFGLVDDLLDAARLRDKGGESAFVTYRSGPLGDLKVSGGYFMPVLMDKAEPAYLTYPVPTPISVRRGQSAMVPLLDATVGYEPLCVYNPAKMLNHPLLVWRLHNTTGVALEQGPVTLMQEAQYLGEGLMRFTGVGEEIQIPYALEFGILVTEEHSYVAQPVWQVAVDRERRRLTVSAGRVDQTIYTLANRMRHDERVFMEWRDPVRGDYFEMPPPDDMADSHTRWGVLVPAGGQATFLLQIREVRTEYREALGWKPAELDELQRAGTIAPELHAALARLRQLADQLSAIQEQITALTDEHAQIAARQEQLRKNLAALGNSERETALRHQLLDDLEASEHRRREVERALHALRQEAESTQQEQQTQTDAVYA